MALLSRFAEVAAGSLYPPTFCDSEGSDRYFRYSNPNVRHYCILKFARAVSSLNASLVLTRAGFNQEICMLVRTTIECTTLIEWAVESLEPEAAHKASVEAHVLLYFSDSDRGPGMVHKPENLSQKNIHRDIARIMDQRATEAGLTTPNGTKELMSRVFLTYSYYVHARYPELMDMFGGMPARLHIQGMLNTPKDRENLDILQTFIRTACLTAWRIILAFELQPRVQNDALLSKWYDDIRAEPDPI